MWKNLARRTGLCGWWVLAGVGLLAAMLIDGASADSFTNSASEGSRFYRLIASYMHGDEKVDFDIVVGCSVRVTDYADNDKSYDAVRDPVVYVKATRDGAAVLQIVSNACRGETTASGEVPKDFLPGAIWFDRKDDLSLGIAYVTEDAFANSKSKLKFLGASIVTATQQEWEAFRPIAAQNLMDPKAFSVIPERAKPEEIKANLWNKQMLATWLRAEFQCYGMERLRLTDPIQRKLLAKYWPAAKPHFWSPGYPRLSDLISEVKLYGQTEVNGHPLTEYADMGLQGAGFPTRARGGMFRSGKPWSTLPAPIFPWRADDGVPWARPELAGAETIYRDADLQGGSNLGFAYCYSFYGSPGLGPITDYHLPNYLQRIFVARVDGERVEIEGKVGPAGSELPNFFFEDDQWVYVLLRFGLS